MKRRGGFFLNVVPAALYVVAVFYGGSITGASLPTAAITWGDKILHALAFGGMQLALYRAVRYFAPERDAPFSVRIAFVLSALLGGLLELYQAALPHRSAELLDWVADVMGAAAVALVLGVRSRRQSSEPAAG